MTTGTKRSAIGLVVAIVAAIATWYFQGDGAGGEPQAEPTSTTSAVAPSDTAYPSETSEPSSSYTDDGSGEATGEVDPESGLPWISESELPPEGQETLQAIDSGGPFKYPDRDGTSFTNREGILPDQDSGYYKEYTVETPGSDDRGARRIVAGAGGEFYYTDDHYSSFRRIAR